jgi:phosphoribosylanthranilate isomerase
MSRIKLKICGVQNTQEAEILVDVAVDYIGLNFVPGSKRCIAVDSARAILSIVKDCDIVPVLLFQSQPASQIIELADELDVHLLQLHGNEIEADYSLLRDKNQIIKAIYPGSSIKQQIENFKGDYYLLDRAIQGQGDVVDGESATIANELTDKLFLAGGLDPDNLTGILDVTKPYAVDIASGVRTDGMLDLAKIEQIQAILEQV